MTYDDLSPRDQAFINELGGDNKTVVSAQMVSALNGNGNAAIYLSQLLWWGKRKADEDGWFFRTRDQMQERCGLGKQAQRTAEKTLKTLGLIETDKRGMPAKKHYRIHYGELISLFNGAETDLAPTRKGKSQGVGGATSSGTYPPEQDAGGTCQNPIESNTESNTESGHAPAQEGTASFSDLISIWRDIDATPHLSQRHENTFQKWANEGVIEDLDTFREVLEKDAKEVRDKDCGLSLRVTRENYEDEISPLTAAQRESSRYTVNEDGEPCLDGVPFSEIGPQNVYDERSDGSARQEPEVSVS